MDKVILGDASEKIGSGATPRGGSEVYLSQGEIALIRSQNIYNDGFRKDGLAFITERHAKELDNVAVEHNDILLNITGDSVARCCQVPDDILPARVNQHVAIIRPRKNKLDSQYLRYYLIAPIMQDYMLMLASGGATRNALTKGMIESFEIPSPPLPEQRAIAGILGALDDKIELNRRMNRTLESMARAVFRQWFVENEDVDGWEIRSIGEIVERVGMGPFGSSIKVDTFVDEGVPVINGQQLREFMLEDLDFNFISLEHAEKLKNANVYPGDVVLTHRGTLGQVSLIPYDAKYKCYIVSQSQFFVRCNSEKITPNFLVYYLRSPEGQHKLLANRSAVGVPAIARPVTYLRSIEIAVPPKENLDAFEQIVAPLHRKYSANRRESRTLASLRDSLLPKLMRGEVRVKVEA